MKLKFFVTSLIHQNPKCLLYDLEIGDKILEPQNHTPWFGNSHMDILEPSAEDPRYEKRILKIL